MLKNLLIFLTILTTNVFAGEVTTSNLINKTFTSDNNWKGDNLSSNHGTGIIAGIDGKHVENTNSISVSTDAGLTEAQIQNGFTSNQSAEVWFWNSNNQNVVMKQVITDSANNTVTQTKTVTGSCATLNGCTWQTTGNNSFIATMNDNTDYFINNRFEFNSTVAGNASYSGTHGAADLRNPSLTITFEHDPVPVATQQDIMSNAQNIVEDLSQNFMDFNNDIFKDIKFEDFKPMPVQNIEVEVEEIEIERTEIAPMEEINFTSQPMFMNEPMTIETRAMPTMFTSQPMMLEAPREEPINMTVESFTDMFLPPPDENREEPIVMMMAPIEEEPRPMDSVPVIKEEGPRTTAPTMKEEAPIAMMPETMEEEPPMDNEESVVEVEPEENRQEEKQEVKQVDEKKIEKTKPVRKVVAKSAVQTTKSKKQKSLQQKKIIAANIGKIMNNIDAQIKDISRNLQVKNIIKLNAMKSSQIELSTYNVPFYIPKNIYKQQLNIQDNRKIYANVSLDRYVQNDKIGNKAKILNQIRQDKKKLLYELEMLKNG
tara:strand:- start:129 stop:1754 length:1626 start_codon:yes stop_codon:yes gene_type:complete